MPSIVAIFKDEAQYLTEWITFHRLQGFDNFLMYNNGSSDRGRDICERLGCIVMDWPGDIQQLPAYHDSFTHLPANDWAAFIDIDEYLWCPSGVPVAEMLKYWLDNFPRMDVLEVPWQMFGSNGWTRRPPSLTIDAYTRRSEHDPHVKSIIKPGSGVTFLDPHRTNVDDQRKHNTKGDLLCNHYWTRSAAECLAKFERGRADLDVKRGWEEFTNSEPAINAVLDMRVAELWSKPLREALRATRASSIKTHR